MLVTMGVPKHPPHPATIARASSAHQATIAQAKSTLLPAQKERPPHPACVQPKRAQSPSRSPKRIQRMAEPTMVDRLGQLRQISTDVKNAASVHTEVQGLYWNDKYFFSANTTADGNKTNSDEARVIFARDLHVNARKEVSNSSVYLAAFQKKTPVVVFVPTNNGMHAEQHLLRIIAEALYAQEDGLYGSEIAVGGYNCPCKVCEPVVKSFAYAFGRAYKGTLYYDMTPRQGVQQHGGGGAQLSLADLLDQPNVDLKFAAFALDYQSALDRF